MSKRRFAGCPRDGGVESLGSVATPGRDVGAGARRRRQRGHARSGPHPQPIYRVDLVGDGGVALDRIRTSAPDLVLSDVMMPTVDGFGLLAAIRADERTRSIPVILLSARAGEEARLEGLHAGANEYLVKPFTARELLASVASQLQLARGRRETLAAKSYLAAIVDSAEDAILSKDLDGVIQSCNASGERVFGYRADELIGQPVRMLIPPERQAEEDDILARLRRGERVEHFETVRMTKDGRRLTSR
jgi:PAS domain S-box-containing protein